MPNISTARLRDAAKLLQGLVKKVDNGDEVLTAWEVGTVLRGEEAPHKRRLPPAPAPETPAQGTERPHRKPASRTGAGPTPAAAQPAAPAQAIPVGKKRSPPPATQAEAAPAQAPAAKPAPKKRPPTTRRRKTTPSKDSSFEPPVKKRPGQPESSSVGSTDAVTYNALIAAINKVKSQADRSVAGILAGIDAARDEGLSADKDGSKSLSETEQKKVKTVLGKALLAFAQAHGGDSLSDFKVPYHRGVYVPRKPFSAPAGTSAPEVVNLLAKYFNSWGNDNHENNGNLTRLVFGEIETRGIANAIAKMPKAQAKDVLKELEKRIHQGDQVNWNPPRIWITPLGVPLLDKLAEDLGVQANFVGQASAPHFDYW